MYYSPVFLCMCMAEYIHAHDLWMFSVHVRLDMLGIVFLGKIGLGLWLYLLCFACIEFGKKKSKAQLCGQ